MGTSWTVKYAASNAPPAKQLQAVIERALGCVIAQMSSWDVRSNLSRFHQREVSNWYDMPTEMAHVIKAALRIADESDGAYDPTLGTLVNLWGFGPAGPRDTPPDADTIRLLHRQTGRQKIERSLDGTRLRRQSDCQLDLSGIAKGFAVDLVGMTLRAQGITDYLVEIGGELLGRGVKPDGTPWWVDIDDGGAGLPPLRVGLHERAVATSGSERAFHAGETVYPHTIDPRTGWPINNGMISATVLHHSCMEADAYATALMVLGPDAAIAFADTHKLAALIRHRADADAPLSEQMSSAFTAMLDEA